MKELYCEGNGRPSINPVVLFKIVLIQHIYGNPSLRRTLEEVNMNIAYHWFIGYPLNEKVPHFSTVSYNFKHRFNHATVEHVFQWVLNTAAEEGYLDTEAVFVDGTHIKANANLKKQTKKVVPKEAKRYTKELFNEVNKDREQHGKKPFSDDVDKTPPEEKVCVTSTTDPESGVFHKGVQSAKGTLDYCNNDIEYAKAFTLNSFKNFEAETEEKLGEKAQVVYLKTFDLVAKKRPAPTPTKAKGGTHKPQP